MVFIFILLSLGVLLGLILLLLYLNPVSVLYFLHWTIWMVCSAVLFTCIYSVLLVGYCSVLVLCCGFVIYLILR